MAKQRQSLGATAAAMWREGVKDVRQTLVTEAWSGKAEHAPEMGTPLNPTPQMVTEDLKGQQMDGYDAHLQQKAEAAMPDPAMEMEADHDRE